MLEFENCKLTRLAKMNMPDSRMKIKIQEMLSEEFANLQ